MTRLFALFAVLALAACGSPEDAGQGGAAATSSPAGAASASPGAADNQVAAAPGSAQSDAATGIRSEYTRFSLDACRQGEWIEEGSSGSWQCPGYGGIGLVVLTGDGRFDIDAGQDNGTFESISPFNDLGTTVEWRVGPDGRPFAIIYRVRSATPEARERSVLFAETVGSKGKPGCLLARIAGSAEDANGRARRAADQALGGIDCAKVRPLELGEVR